MWYFSWLSNQWAYWSFDCTPKTLGPSKHFHVSLPDCLVSYLPSVWQTTWENQLKQGQIWFSLVVLRLQLKVNFFLLLWERQKWNTIPCDSEEEAAPFMVEGSTERWRKVPSTRCILQRLSQSLGSSRKVLPPCNTHRFMAGSLSPWWHQLDTGH